MHKEFINIDDAIDWENNVVAYYRALWLRERDSKLPYVNMRTRKAIEVFQKYFNDKSHKYRLLILEENGYIKLLPSATRMEFEREFRCMEINTKFFSFRFTDKDRLPGGTDYSIQCGYEYYQIDYTLQDNVITIFSQSKEEVEDKRAICEIKLPTDLQRDELLTVLEFMKGGNGLFTDLFDMSVNCVDEFRNESLTFDTYFRGPSVKPLVFYAEVSFFDEDYPLGDSFREKGVCKVSLSIHAPKGEKVPDIWQLFLSEGQYDLHLEVESLTKPAKPLGNHTYTPIRRNEYNYDVYLDRRKKVVYSGTLQEYILSIQADEDQFIVCNDRGYDIAYCESLA